jgi:hypothetical protein
MFDQEARKALADRIESFEATAPEGESTPAAEALWESWVTQGYQLQELGAAPNAMCDTINQIAATRAEVHEGTRGTASRG